MIKRTQDGLIDGVTYIKNDDGTINWRRMIDHQFLVVQREYEDAVSKQHGKPHNEVDRTLIEDKHLLILLGGIKRLLFLRGYKSLHYRVDHVSGERCVVTCTIEFIPNYETGYESVTYSDVASASLYNTSGSIPQQFLEATAANRALVRCVRSFLNVNIAGKDEIGPSKADKEADKEKTPSPETSGSDPCNSLARRCQELGLSFEQMRGAAVKYKTELKSNPEEWKGFEGVPNLDCFVLLGKMVKKDKAEAKK